MRTQAGGFPPRFGFSGRALRWVFLAFVVLAPRMPVAAHAQEILVVEEAPSVSEIGGWTEAEEGEGLAFGVGVSNPSGEGLDFRWDPGDGTPTVGGPGQRAVTHRYRQNGDFTLLLGVSGSAGFSADRQLQIRVRNAAPTIRGITHTDGVQPGRPVVFQADAVDPGDDELTYTWDFGDRSPPQSGVDLRRVTHQYATPGNYVVTLTVVDGDGGEDVQTMAVGAIPGLLGVVGGEIPVFQFAGVSGRSSLLNPLPGTRALPIGNTPLLTGSAPMGGGVADLSDAMGICLLNAGFWDDENKAHINFAITAKSDSVFEPRAFIVGWDTPANGQIPPDQLMVNALLLGIDPSYADAKEGAQNQQVFDPLSGISGVQDLIGAALGGTLGGRLGGIFGGGGQAPQMGPGRNYQLTSSGGYIRITRVTTERIQGEINVVLRGAWMGREGTGEVRYAEVKGNFVWELDEVGRANLARCGDRPFTIESHTPSPEHLNTSFSSPGISITFTDAVQGATLTAETIQIGYRADGEFVTIEGTLLPDPDGRVVHFTPAEPLKDTVFYHVRIRGGDAGVHSITGEALVEDYEWRFSTVVDLLPPAP